MKKNVASQVVGAQMISASDGSAFTGSVTVYVTGNGGTQAAGSVGSGACTHEGNGFHTYAPAQAETNYDHVAFTFTGTGAIPVTVQIYTTFPQTGDNYARLGAPAGASIAADIAGVKAVTDKLDTTLEAAGGSPGDYQFRADALRNAPKDGPGIDAAGVRAAVGLASANLDTQLSTISGYIDTEVAAIKAKTDNLPSDPADASDIAASFAAVNSSLSTIASYIDTEVASIKSVTDKLDTTLEAATGSPGDWRFSADALRKAPTGSGGGSGITASDVWNEAVPAGYSSGSAGYVLGNLAATLASVDVIVSKLDTLLESAGGSPGDYRLSLDALRNVTSLVPTAVQNADALLDRDMSAGTDSGSPTVRTPRQALRILRNKWSISGSTQTITKEDDTTTSWTQVLGTTAGADPVTSTDPA